jgi:glycosyltransferase involved in cell wall biosynthesis
MTDQQCNTRDMAGSFIPLKEPIPITEQTWPEGTVPLVHTRTMTYNHEPYIGACIEAILMQKTTFPVVVLIHDDASTDATASIVRTYEARYPNLIKAYYQQRNSLSHKDEHLRDEFNTWRVGTYEALCEGDDYWTDPLKLQKQVTLLEEDPGLSVVVGGFDQLAFDGSTQEQMIRIRANDTELGYRFRAMDMTKGWITQTLTLVYRVSAKKGYDPSLFKYNRDVHLNVHLLHHGDGFYITQKLGVYRQHSQGMHSGASESAKAQVLYACYKELHAVFRTEVTRRLYLISINILIRNATIGVKEVGRVCREAFRSIKRPIELVRLMKSLLQWLVGIAKQKQAP